MELHPCQSNCFLPHSLGGKWMWGVPSLSKIRDMYHILCIYVNILVFCIYSFYVFVTKQRSSLTASAAMRAWKKGGKRSLFHSPLSAMKGGSALLSPAMVEATTICLLHEATVEEELKRWFFYLLGKKSYQKCLENISSTERLKKFHLLSSLQLSLKVDQITQLCGNWLNINCSIIIKTWFTNVVTDLLVLSTCQRNMENAHEELACLTAAMGKL